MHIILQRLTDDGSQTFGVIIKNNKPVFVTLEPPWKNNQHDISCIPAVTYQCLKIFSNRFQKMLFEIQNVPDRGYVEMHIGNKVQDTHGCVLLGTAYSVSECAIVNSKLAFDSFMAMMPNEFTMTIKDTIVKEDALWI
jgi:hypothetical protein